VAHGFEVELEKGIPIGAGLGGSAASCVAALVAANALLDAPLPREALYPCAIDGEAVSSHSRQGDNVAPMLLGGVVLATAERMIAWDERDWLTCAFFHPVRALNTRPKCDVLVSHYPLATLVRHGAHLALFLTVLQLGHARLIRDALCSVLAVPR